MENEKSGFTTIDAYIAAYPEKVQAKLKEMRAIIKAAAADATEKISYGMPAFVLHGNLVYFGASKNHLGFYPRTSVIVAFAEELTAYEQTKGSIHFPYDQPLPADLITRIVQSRVIENLEYTAKKKSRRSSKKNEA